MKYIKLCGFQNNFFLLFFMENLSMILFVSRYCRRPDSMHNNESELNLVCSIVDLSPTGIGCQYLFQWPGGICSRCVFAIYRHFVFWIWLHNNESELNLVCSIVDLRWFFTLDRVEKDLQEEVILKSTQFTVLHVLLKLIMLQVNCISFIITIYKM
jgi:hypothetical protein